MGGEADLLNLLRWHVDAGADEAILIRHGNAIEGAASNLFVVIDGEIITPPKSQALLPGITRDSTIKLLQQWQVPVSEKQISIDEVMEAGHNGRLKEMFGTGTAAVISPVGSIHYKDESVVINDGRVGELSQRLFDEITAIQYGDKEDVNNWIETVRV